MNGCKIHVVIPAARADILLRLYSLFREFRLRGVL